MKPRKYSQLTFGLVLGIGTVIALVLCIQCVRTYLYTDAVLVPQYAEHEAARQAGAVSAAARSAGITDPRKFGPAMERVIESSSDRILWMRVLDLNTRVLAQAGTPEATAKFLSRWWNRVEGHDPAGTLVNTPSGKAWIVLLPLRMPWPAHRGPEDRHPEYALELAISLKAIASTFEGLRQNLIVGLIASIALLLSMAVIGLRARYYFRGKYLENELQLARRVQRDLQPKPHSVSAKVEFAASSLAADHVGGDFFDIFEADSTKIAIVLGDVSGKGVPAALLVSVLQGAIRSSVASQHEFACERINRMLCERTACERFATLFWGVFDTEKNTLTYVNAGHAAPILMGRDRNRIERLDEGGPVLGLLPEATYSAGNVNIESGDTLILYSDGISEAMNRNHEQFGEDRITGIVSNIVCNTPDEICNQLMNHLTAFSNSEGPQDDKTLVVVTFPHSGAALRNQQPADIPLAAVA